MSTDEFIGEVFSAQKYAIANKRGSLLYGQPNSLTIGIAAFSQSGGVNPGRDPVYLRPTHVTGISKPDEMFKRLSETYVALVASTERRQVSAFTSLTYRKYFKRGIPQWNDMLADISLNPDGVLYPRPASGDVRDPIYMTALEFGRQCLLLNTGGVEGFNSVKLSSLYYLLRAAEQFFTTVVTEISLSLLASGIGNNSDRTFQNLSALIRVPHRFDDAEITFQLGAAKFLAFLEDNPMQELVRDYVKTGVFASAIFRDEEEAMTLGASIAEPFAFTAAKTKTAALAAFSLAYRGTVTPEVVQTSLTSHFKTTDDPIALLTFAEIGEGKFSGFSHPFGIALGGMYYQGLHFMYDSSAWTKEEERTLKFPSMVSTKNVLLPLKVVPSYRSRHNQYSIQSDPDISVDQVMEKRHAQKWVRNAAYVLARDEPFYSILDVGASSNGLIGHLLKEVFDTIVMRKRGDIFYQPEDPLIYNKSFRSSVIKYFSKYGGGFLIFDRIQNVDVEVGVGDWICIEREKMVIFKNITTLQVIVVGTPSSFIDVYNVKDDSFNFPDIREHNILLHFYGGRGHPFRFFPNVVVSDVAIPYSSIQYYGVGTNSSTYNDIFQYLTFTHLSKRFPHATFVVKVNAPYAAGGMAVISSFTSGGKYHFPRLDSFECVVSGELSSRPVPYGYSALPPTARDDIMSRSVDFFFDDMTHFVSVFENVPPPAFSFAKADLTEEETDDVAFSKIRWDAWRSFVMKMTTHPISGDNLSWRLASKMFEIGGVQRLKDEFLEAVKGGLFIPPPMNRSLYNYFYVLRNTLTLKINRISTVHVGPGFRPIPDTEGTVIDYVLDKDKKWIPFSVSRKINTFRLILAVGISSIQPELICVAGVIDLKFPVYIIWTLNDGDARLIAGRISDVVLSFPKPGVSTFALYTPSPSLSLPLSKQEIARLGNTQVVSTDTTPPSPKWLVDLFHATMDKVPARYDSFLSAAKVRYK